MRVNIAVWRKRMHIVFYLRHIVLRFFDCLRVIVHIGIVDREQHIFTKPAEPVEHLAQLFVIREVQVRQQYLPGFKDPVASLDLYFISPLANGQFFHAFLR